MRAKHYKAILFFVFIGIFIITALLTLLGITGLIAIDKSYLNTLFTVLLIELVGAVIAVYRSADFFKDEPETPTETQPPLPEPTREFFTGRWRVEQDQGDRSGGTLVNYLPDGQCVGTTEVFQGGGGSRREIRGKWDIEKIGPGKFILSVRYEDGLEPFKKTFKIVDQNRIHNVDMNYDAVRVED